MSKDEQNSIEEKMNRLDAMTAWFTSDEFSLDEAFDKYQEIEVLSGEIEAQLESMENEVEVIKAQFDSTQTAE
ncbi:exodeoxyribonuclease VII small subunit [Candidatus Saccharibacteria bacterium]|nr:exodeoxyribonuclease VII small subunit [Candidatus Saccharibacteria bacterium]